MFEMKKSKFLCQQLEELSEAISHARVRLDAVRLIWKGGSSDPISNC